jgi:hypothetical protein
MNSNPEPVTNLLFDRDGTLPVDVLATLPEDLRARVTSPEFIANARAAIKKAVQRDQGVRKTGRRESQLDPIRMMFDHGGPNRKQRRRLQAALRG